MHPFRLHEWLFVVSLGISAVLSLGAALGLAGQDADGDDGSDGDGDSDADAADEGWGVADVFATVFGLGRAPLTVALFGWTCIFGLAGWTSAPAFGALLPRPVDALASVSIAFAVAVVGNRAFTGLVGRLLPPVETYASSPNERRGLVGVVVLRLSDHDAEVRVRHADGTSLRIRAESDEPMPPVGGQGVRGPPAQRRRRDLVTPLPPEAITLSADLETEEVR